MEMSINPKYHRCNRFVVQVLHTSYASLSATKLCRLETFCDRTEAYFGRVEIFLLKLDFFSTFRINPTRQTIRAKIKIKVFQHTPKYFTNGFTFQVALSSY